MMKEILSRNVESFASSDKIGTSTGVFDESRFSSTIWSFTNFTKDAHAEQIELSMSNNNT